MTEPDDSDFSVGDGGITTDAFLGSALSVQQPRNGYRAGIDAVLLAAAAPAPDRDRAWRYLDVGAGVGVVGLAIASRLPSAGITLVERHRDLCELARRNVTLNHLEGRVTVAEHDITAPSDAGIRTGLADESFDVTLANPPFHEAGSHRPSPDPIKAGAHSMPAAGLDQWLRFMARMTRPGGTCLVIHRADRLAALLEAVSRRFGAIVVMPLYPRSGQSASRVIISAIKGNRSPLRIAPGIILHGPGNEFTAEVKMLLSGPKALDVRPGP